MMEEINRLISKTGYILGRDFELEITKDKKGFETAKITCLISGISKTYSPARPLDGTPRCLTEVRNDFSTENRICNTFHIQPRKVKVYRLSLIHSKLSDRIRRIYKNIPEYIDVVVPEVKSNENYENLARNIVQREMTIAIPCNEIPVEFPWLNPEFVTVEMLSEINVEPFNTIIKIHRESGNKSFPSEKWVSIQEKVDKGKDEVLV